MPRDICQKCQYPVKTCLCSYLQPVKHKTRIIILQHPSEVKNAKNTVRLLTLLSDNIATYIGESETDFLEIKQLVTANPEHYAVIFPSEKSRPINSDPKVISEVNNIILIDGTWNKAKKIMYQNPWLSPLMHLTFAIGTETEYKIRKSNFKGGMSTLESAAYSLVELDQIDPSSMFVALNGLNTQFTAQMPAQVAKRYKKLN
ncbi:tRNA-uridine aminocarboxypropyltransferase [Psychrosphaera aquimarina]|uniref:tRNA-uridine aminocarboxypropyltransferase n=1 Tax=Psychrosphaera aquimarina TaxID=2044854 RepID=A0ABU3R4V0_9GAMM|nr:tRNA-uridine aminocarboxypropyltransferase [Psychrosphaera aquimarina]MDU0114709.1 tRNA-uridine aminocarboxypropyltransferase [Psychrosphaera aquimarina]